MSRRHAASRRRSYGRRQHEVRERQGRRDGLDTWLEQPDDVGDLTSWHRPVRQDGSAQPGDGR